jgi:XTP/dITP diphosphohydrolase
VGETLIIATTNAGKLREIQAMLAGLPLVVRALSVDDDVPAPEETGQTFAENARLKALYYATVTGALTVAEDSGLEIDALNGRPGVLSARYPGATYEERFRNLYAELAAARDPDGTHAMPPFTARFVCALTLARGNDILFEARGTVEGEIADEPRGTEGFGYDPIFYYPPYHHTLAEVSDEEKARVSHRGVAFRQLRAFLQRAGAAAAAPKS